MANRNRLDPLVKLFREWAGVEVQGASGDEAARRKIGRCRQMLEFSGKEITALVWSKYTVSELVALACLGDDKSLLRLVELDKLFLTAQFSRDRIRQAVGIEDRKFFRELSKSVKRDAYRENVDVSKLGIACYLLWFLGFDKLGKRKLLDFVESEGLAQYPDAKSFDRFLSRIGIKSHATLGDKIRD